MDKKKNYLIGGLLIAIIAMAVGYAALAQRLDITGTATIKGDVKWDVKFTNISSSFENGASNDVDESSQEILPTASGTSATFSVNLPNPGAKATYTITIKNAGTIDAKLDSITDLTTGSSDAGDTPGINPQDPTQIVFTVTGITEGETLAAGATKDITVTAEWSGDTMPNSEVSKTAVIYLNFVQA